MDVSAGPKRIKRDQKESADVFFKLCDDFIADFSPHS
jgi:hypothetical protein